MPMLLTLSRAPNAQKAIYLKCYNYKHKPSVFAQFELHPSFLVVLTVSHPLLEQVYQAAGADDSALERVASAVAGDAVQYVKEFSCFEKAKDYHGDVDLPH